MGAARRLVVPLGIGATVGAVDSLVNAVSSPYTAVGSRADGTGWAAGARFLGFLLDAGWAWAAVAVAVGWLAGGRLRSALAGAGALVAATTAYYAMDSWARGEPFLGHLPELYRWWVAGTVLGAALGVVGAAGRRPGTTGLLAQLVVPLGAAVQMAVSPPGFGGSPVPAEAVAARWLVWTGAVLTAALVLVRGGRTASRRPPQPVGQ